MSTTPRQFLLPDLFTVCPFEASINRHYAQVSVESSTWIRSYNIAIRQSWSQTESELLAAYAYPHANYEKFRTCCDFLNVVYLMDMLSEEMDKEDLLKMGYAFYNGMLDEGCDDDSQFFKMGKAFRRRLLLDPLQATFPRLLHRFKEYIEAVGREIEDRKCHRILDLDAFQTLRRDYSAGRVVFVMISYSLDTDIPDYIYENPILTSMHMTAVDMLCWSNDLYSYSREEAMGQATSNVMTILMKERNLDLQGAADAIGMHFSNLVHKFLSDKSRLPSWGPDVDQVVAGYVKGMEDWVMGNLVWCFETPRYFGVDRYIVKDSRMVNLRPRDVILA